MVLADYRSCGGGRWFGNQICWISLTGLGLKLSGVSLVWRVLIGGGIGGICWSYVVAGFGAD